MEEKAKAVGHIPSGLFIVCGRDKTRNIIDGYLASWVQQISFDPLLISLAVKPGRPAYDAITSGEVFSINIIGDHDKSYMKHFWKGYDPAVNPFDEIPHKETESGAIILEQSKSTIVCVMKEKHKPGDHELIIAEVIESHIQDGDAKPLIHTRKSGLDY